ncbi:MAG: FlgO family outer membrane protein [Pyrinomonadaceae bacterium]
MHALNIQAGGLSSEEEAATAIKPQGTSPGMVIGTANYMSPEQAKGREVDARTDIFSFGIVLYEMLSSKRAFAGENALEVIGAILHKEPTPLKQVLPELPGEIERIVNKTLRKDADERYQTARDLLTDLKDAKRELEFQDKLERTAAPNRENPKTQLTAATTDEARPPTSSAEFITQEVKKHKRGVTLGALVLLALIGVGFWFIFNRTAGNKQIESIAVMPFVNESGNADVEYLSDGMTETLINSLSQIPNLSVKARSSVFRYKGKELDPKKIASELNVQAILTGRVIQRGDQLMLSLELIDAQTENVIWSEQYSRKQADLVTLQSEIARDVSSKLKSKLSGADEAKLAKTSTANTEAYHLYLRGRFSWNKRTGEALKQAVDFYKQAIEIDPNFALAYSGLAETYVLFSSYSVALPKDSMPQAKAAAQRALELDDSLAEAHTALAEYLNHYEFDRAGAEREFRRAIELNPNYATAHQWYGNLLTALKRFDEAHVELGRAEELDPLAPIIGSNLGDTLLYARRYDEAIAQCKRTLSVNPIAVAHFSLGAAYAAKGMYTEAYAELRKYLEMDPDPTGKGYLGHWLAKSGQREEAMKLVSELKQESTQRYVQSIALAVIYIGLDEKEDAMVWLEREISERGANARYFAVLVELDSLRSEPRFKGNAQAPESAGMNLIEDD